MLIKGLGKRLGIVLVIGALSAVGAALLLRPSERCSTERRLDKLLAGGVPVCLGGSFAPLKRVTDSGSLHLDNSGGGYFTLSRDGRTYTYMADGGFAPFIDGAYWARVATACVKGSIDTAEVGYLAKQALADLGSTWEPDTALSNSWRSVWKTEGGLRVYANSFGEFCLSDL